MIQETAEFVRAGSAEGVSVRIAFVSNNIVRAIIAYVVLTFAVFELAVGQHHHATAPTKPAVLMTGLGNVHHTVSTRNAEAQQFFNQGLALVYAFNHDEALRSFQRAAQLDPQLAMAYWGMALAIGPNYITKP